MTIKILSFSYRDDVIVVLTDNVDRPEFVYPVDRFKNKGALISEIKKSIKYEKARKDKKAEHKTALEASLNAGN